MKKVIIISTNEIDCRIVTLFAIEDVLKNNVEVEYWNVSALTYKETIQECIIKGVVTISFDDILFFKRKVKEEKDTNNPLFIVYMNYGYKTYRFYRILSKYDCEISYCVNGVMPNYEMENGNNKINTLFKKITDKEKLSNISRILKKRYYNFLKKTFLLKATKYEFLTCENATPEYKVDEFTTFVGYNSTDYEFYINAIPYEHNKPYIVFIDQFLPLHPDVRIVKLGRLIPELYYDQINSLFKLIEEKYDCDVIIAGHPVARDYYLKNDKFEGRRVIIGQTAGLVKGAAGVVAHFSTAISFAVLGYKPLLLVSSIDMKNKMLRLHKATIAISDYLGCPFKMLDDIDNSFLFEEVDVDKYNSYKYGFITNRHSEKRSNSEILLALLSSEK